MPYKIALFLHVVGVLLLCATLSIEWLFVINIRLVKSVDRIKEIITNYSTVTATGGLALILILVPGIYMMVKAWHGGGWIVIGFLGLFVIAAIGGIMTGSKIRAIKKILTGNNSQSQSLNDLLINNSLLLSVKLRTTIFLGIIFMMTIKPEMAGSFIALVISIIIGTIPFMDKANPKEINDTV